MTIEFMTISISGNENQDAYNKKTYPYTKKISLSGVRNSNAIAMPQPPVNSISIHQTGNAEIYLTNYSFKDIRNNIAVWTLYDGTSEINTAITAMYAKNTAGNTTVQITAMRNV